MDDKEWMESVGYEVADKIEEWLKTAYDQGVNDAWNNVKKLRKDANFSIEWTADEMMQYAEKGPKAYEEVKKIANDIGINTLYAMVRDMRGE